MGKILFSKLCFLFITEMVVVKGDFCGGKGKEISKEFIIFYILYLCVNSFMLNIIRMKCPSL